jgi:hypothetical protein
MPKPVLSVAKRSIPVTKSVMVSAPSVDACLECIALRAAGERVEACAADQRSAGVSAIDQIAADPAVDGIVPVAAGQRIPALGAEQLIAAPTAEQRIVGELVTMTLLRLLPLLLLEPPNSCSVRFSTSAPSA